MSILMPDINLRRRRKCLEAFWRDALHESSIVNASHHSPRTISSWSRRHSSRASVSSAGSKIASTDMSSELSSSHPSQHNKHAHGVPTLASVLNSVRMNEGDVRELDFSSLAARNKRLDPAGGVLVARVLATNETVKRLVLRDHAIGDEGARAIADMLCVNFTLEHIDLSGNSITDDGAEAIAYALYGQETVTHLSLWSNQITSRGAKCLAEALKCNRMLRYLGLVHNRIDTSGGQAFLDALEVNMHLESLNLAINRVPASIVVPIRAALARNRVESPGILSELAKEEAEMERRLMESMASATPSSVESGRSGTVFLSASSGFLSCWEGESENLDDDGWV